MLLANRYVAAYGASKAAVISLTRTEGLDVSVSSRLAKWDWNNNIPSTLVKVLKARYQSELRVSRRNRVRLPSCLPSPFGERADVKTISSTPMTAPIPDDDDIVHIAPLGRKGALRRWPMPSFFCVARRLRSFRGCNW